MRDNENNAGNATMSEAGITISEFRRALQHERSASTPDDTPVRPSADRRVHTIKYEPFADGDRGLYAVIDMVTNAIVGGVMIHVNTAAAIRTLAEIARADTIVRKNPLDFQLWLLGSISKDHTISPEASEIILTGEQISAMIDLGHQGA